MKENYNEKNGEKRKTVKAAWRKTAPSKSVCHQLKYHRKNKPMAGDYGENRRIASSMAAYNEKRNAKLAING
jgi:hypothetical protein